MSESAFSNSGVTLEVRDLHKSFRRQHVLRGVSFEMKAGEIFVIMGPSGCGKSVLLRHLIGLERPDSGEILIQGEPVNDSGTLETYRLGMVFQSGALLNSLTVGENVGLYLREHELKPEEEIARIVTEKLKVVGLDEVEHKMPSELSGGMKKRAAIARTLVMEPQLIFYDEPTSELDPVSAVRIANEILNLNRKTGVTSLVVTHDRQMAFDIAQRIAVMQHGELVAIGTPDEVRQSTEPAVKDFLNASINPEMKVEQP